jgi:MFS family permease
MGSAILSVRSLFSFVTTFFVGWYFRRISLRMGIVVGTLIGAAASLVFSVGGSALVYYLGAAMAGIGYGLGCAYPVALLLANWFHARRGLAFGISTAGSGLAFMVFSPLLSAIILRFSLTTAFVFQAGFLVFSALLVLLVVRDRPEDMGLRPYGEGCATAKAVRTSLAPPLSPLILGLMAVLMLLIGGAGLSFSGHLSVLGTTCGYSPELAAKVISLFGFILFLSKMAAGEIADRIGPRNSSILLVGVFSLGCFAVLGMDGVSLFWYYVLAVLLGIGSAICTVGPPLWSGDLAPAEEYSKSVKWLQIFYNLGGILFNVVPGIIADHTGEYKSSFFLFAAMMTTGLLILLWCYRRQGVARRSGKVRT